MEVKYLCLEHIFFRWPKRQLALALASKTTRPALALASNMLASNPSCEICFADDIVSC